MISLRNAPIDEFTWLYVSKFNEAPKYVRYNNVAIIYIMHMQVWYYTNRILIEYP